jgi:Na+/proline symporter
MSAVLFAIVFYVLVQFAIGVWVSRRIRTASDYILAGRRLGAGLVAFSVFSTYFGAEALVASGGAVYENGLSGALVDPLCYAAAIIIVGVFFAHALWSRGLTTFADLFRQRYSPGVEKLVVVVLLPGSVIWAAAQVRAFGQILDANSGIGLATAVLLATVLIAGYSVIGGLLADAVTDVIQGVVLLIGLLALGIVVATQVDFGAVVAQVEPQRLRIVDPEQGLLGTLEKMAIPICGTVVAVDLISSVLGAHTATLAARGTLIGGLMYLVVGTVPVFLGFVAPSLIPNHPDPEQIVVRLAEVYLPGALHIIFVGAVISAILSVVHAALHAPAAQISHNIIVRLTPGLSDRAKLWSVRSTVMVLSVVAFLISLTSDTIKELVETASAFGSAGVFVATLFALFTRFGGPLSAYVSIASGMLVWAIARYGFQAQAPYLLGLVTALVGYVAAAAVAPSSRI